MMYSCGHNEQGHSVPEYWALSPEKQMPLSSGQCPACVSARYPRPEKTVHHRLDDLEHDNNMLRRILADVQTENTRLAQSNEELGKRIVRLCNTVDDMVGRFSRVS